MKIDYENIQKQYEEKETSDLLDLHKSGTLSEEAYEIIESVLIKRGERLPDRPTDIAAKPKKPLPTWVRIMISIGSLAALSVLFEMIVKPITGRGIIPWGLAVVLPWLFFHRLLFPRKTKK